MEPLQSVIEHLRGELEMKNVIREKALTLSRELVRLSANTIRAVHRGEWETAADTLHNVDGCAQRLIQATGAQPDIFYAGYTQDALKEMVEAHLVFALRRGENLPGPSALHVPGATYLGGLAEAASELRRAVLDLIRADRAAEAEALLDIMDSIYDSLMGFDYPDAITDGLRHKVDNLRAVLERTRGDLTNSLSQGRLLAALKRSEV